MAQKAPDGTLLPAEKCMPFTSIATLKKYAYSGKIPGVKVVPAVYRSSKAYVPAAETTDGFLD